MTSLQHLGGDRWLVRVPDGTKPNGQPWQASRTIRAPNRRAAAAMKDKVAAELRRELAARKEKARVESDPMALTVARLTGMWLAARRTEEVTPATIEQYETNANRWLPILGDKLAVDLTPTDIDAWVRALTVKTNNGKDRRPAAATTKRQAVKDLAQCLRFAARKFPGQFPSEPMTSAVTLPKHRVKRTVVPELDDMRDALPMMLEQGPVGIAGAIALGAGLRQGEVCGLQWTAIRRKRIHVVAAVKRHGDLLAAPKRESIREIPISEVANDAFMAAAEWVEGTSLEGSPWVLPSPRGDGPWRPSSISHAWPAVAGRVGLEGVTFHALRHACGSLLLQEGVPVAVVSAALGHANVAITMEVYAHVLGKIGDDIWQGSDRKLR